MSASLVEAMPIVKSPSAARSDRHAGAALAFAVFALVVVVVLVGLRRLRGRVMEDRADRLLRERIEHLEGDDA